MKRIALLLLASCVQDASFLAAPCPCGVGFVCCEAMGICLSEGDASCPQDPPPFRIDRIEPSSGPVERHTEVVIAGAGFTEEIVISFGPIPCHDLVVKSDSRATCVTPYISDRLGLVDVTLTDGVRSMELPGGFRFVLRPFVDVTSSSGLGPTGAGLGVAFHDANQDGLLDLFFTRGGPESPRLAFSNLGGLRFTDITGAWTTRMDTVQHVTGGDFNNDGNGDLAVTRGKEEDGVFMVAVLVGQGNGRFEVRAEKELTSTGAVRSPSTIDLDGDGDLDVVGGRKVPPGVMIAMNEAGELIDDPSLAPIDHPMTSCWGSSLGDFDGDGDADFVLSGSGLTLMENVGGSFVDVTAISGLPANPEGVQIRTIEWIDFDGDGDLDLVYPPVDDTGGDIRWRRQGTVFFENLRRPDRTDEPPSFATVTTPLDLDLPISNCAELLDEIVPGAALIAGHATGTWQDADFDGDLDLFLPLPASSCLGDALLYESRFADGDPGFAAVPIPAPGAFAAPTGSGSGDLDNDGDLDIVLHSWGFGGRWAILRNNLMENGEAVTKGAYLAVRAVTDRDGDATDEDDHPDRDAPGVVVELDLDGPPDNPDFLPGPGKMQVRMLLHSGFSPAVPPIVHFGLGQDPNPVWVRTRFPDGSDVRRRVETFNQTVVLRDCAASRCVQ